VYFCVSLTFLGRLKAISTVKLKLAEIAVKLSQNYTETQVARKRVEVVIIKIIFKIVNTRKNGYIPLETLLWNGV